jgi:outer membrane protein OmpA-like peptidoglycan-associated protein
MSANIHFKSHMKNHLGLSITTAALLLSFTTAGAEDSPSDRNFANRWYVGAGPQLSWLKPRTSDTGYKVDDDTSSGGQAFIGFDLFKRLSIEGYYADQGKAGVAESAGDIRGDIDYQQYGVSAIGYLFNSRSANDYSSGFDDEGAYRHEGWSAFGRVGLGGMKNHASPELNHRRLENTALVLGGGVEYGWANGFAGRAEFTSYDKDSKMLGISVLKRFGKPSPYQVEVPAAAAATVAALTAPLASAGANMDLPNVQFGLNKSDLKQEAILQLDKITDQLKSNPNLGLSVEGHACELGTVKYNQGLSERRANSVVEYLTSKGIDGSRLKSAGFGETRPIADNSTKEGRVLNRRVEFKITE